MTLRSVNSPASTGKMSYRVMNLRSSRTPRFARVGHRDGERAAVALERKDEVLRRELGRDELDDPRIDLEPRQVDGRHAMLPRDELRELGLLDEAELHEVVAEARAALLLLLQRA